MDDGLRRQPYFADEAFDRPFLGRHYEDPYFYDQTAHGMKRPFFRTVSRKLYPPLIQTWSNLCYITLGGNVALCISIIFQCLVFLTLTSSFFHDKDPDYMEPSRHRPRLDYSDPAVSLRRSRYRGIFVITLHLLGILCLGMLSLSGSLLWYFCC